MISPALVDLARCPDCGGALARTGERVQCAGCGRVFVASAGYLDLRPKSAFAEQTKYLDEALHADARHETVSPPLLGSKIRHDMLRKMLAPGAGDRVIDLGCGSGRSIMWHASSGAALTGIDISPFFSREAVAGADLMLGDLRRLPIKDAAFTKAWSLDVLEHLSREALTDMLAEANRVLTPGGALFVYTHVRKNGWPASGVRFMNTIARLLDRWGLIDLRQERLRKSDHINPLTDHDDLARVMASAGFDLERVVYYTPVVGAFVENILVRLAERAMARRANTRLAHAGAADADAAVREARTTAKAVVARRGSIYRVLQALSFIMKIDVALFGRIKSGPFFAVVRKRSPSNTNA